jgi:acyl dehydratase
MARVLKDFFGPEALRRFQMRFSKQVWPGDTLTCTAKVTGKREEHGEALIDLECAVTNQNGDACLTGSATAVVPKRG